MWEVERLLDECQELPQVLLMENVPQVHSEGDNFNNFRDWINKLDSLGYNSYFQDLNAKNYGVPQNRNRCFMVSLLGEYDYEFPKPFPLKLRMKDLLDSKVDEKYYLSDTMVDYILDVKNTQQGSEWEGRADSGAINKDVALTLGCRSAGGHQRACVSNFVLDGFDQEVSVKDLKNSRSQFVNVERERANLKNS